MSADFQKTADLWEAVLREKDADGKRLRMIELAGLLLEQSALTDEELAALSETDRLTDFFIEFLSAAEKAENFFDKALPHLEPELRGGEFEIQVRETNEKLAKIEERSKTLRESYGELLERGDLLLAESAGLEALESELEELKRLDKGLETENMDALAGEVGRLKRKVAETGPRMEKLEADREKLEAACLRMEETISVLESEEKPGAERLLALSERLSEMLEDGWDECDRRLSTALGKLKQKNRSFLEMVSKLDECEKNLMDILYAEKANLELFEKHLTANDDILRSFGNRGHVSESFPQSRLDRTKSLSAEIAEKLGEFDSELKDMLGEVREAVNRIRKLNKTA